MATVYPIGRSYKVTMKDDGNFAEFGAASTLSNVGTWFVQWVPDASYTGSGLGIVGRAMGETAKTNGTPFTSIPYQMVNIDGLVASPAYGYASALITGPSIVQVPSNGLSLAFLISCTGGFGWLYTWDLNGTSNAP